MKKNIIVTAIALSLSTAPVLAADKVNYEQEEVTGLGAGIVIGAIVAGPIGAAVAGAMGIMGGRIIGAENDRDQHQQNLALSHSQLKQAHEKNNRLVKHLHSAEQEYLALEHKLQTAEQAIAQAENTEQLKVNLQFKAGSSRVETLYADQLKQISSLVKTNPDLMVSLSGYADRSGDEKNNFTLSVERIEAVRDMLIKNGVKSANIITHAYGESSPMHAKQNYQGDFFDRRVEIKLQPQQTLTAAND